MKKWTKNKIKDGFKKFIEENGRLPKADEVDEYKDLPSSRQIQRNFGGLVKLKGEFGYENVSFGQGSYRSQIAHRVHKYGRQTELNLEQILCDRFGRVFVHAEKILDNTKKRVDFYVYCPSNNFAVDIFYSQSLRSLQSNVNIKIKKYKKITQEFYLVSVNKHIKQSDIDSYSNSKKISLPKNFKILSIKSFIEIIKKKGKYPNPLKD